MQDPYKQTIMIHKRACMHLVTTVVLNLVLDSTAAVPFTIVKKIIRKNIT